MLVLLCLLAAAESLGAQGTGRVAAEGSGRGASPEAALFAAKNAAVDALAFSVLGRDSLYAELLRAEAFANDWFRAVGEARGSDGSADVRVSLEVDESLLEAIYYGRYSTTVGALLDQGETALSALEALLAEAGSLESQGSLGGAENAYRRAEEKAAEALRIVGPIGDAVFFSSVGKRKAPELKAVVASLQESAAAALERLRADAAAVAVSRLLDAAEAEIAAGEREAELLSPIAADPSSYLSERLDAASAASRSAREAARGAEERLSALSSVPGAEPAALRIRAEALLDRIDALSRRLGSVSEAVDRERFRRSAIVRAASALLFRAPKDVAAFGAAFPVGVYPADGGAESVALPLSLDARLESSFPVGSGGLWCRSVLSFGEDRAVAGAAADVLTQRVDIGLFGRSLFGVGVRWDWLRRYGNDAADAVYALSLDFGAAGTGLGTRRSVPLLVATLSWELPSGEGFMPARELNAELRAVLRPSADLRLEAAAASRARTAPDGSAGHEASAEAGVGFRLPFLRPLLWRLWWSGAFRSPLSDGSVDWSAGSGEGAFRFGLEYAF